MRPEPYAIKYKNEGGLCRMLIRSPSPLSKGERIAAGSQRRQEGAGHLWQGAMARMQESEMELHARKERTDEHPVAEVVGREGIDEPHAQSTLDEVADDGRVLGLEAQAPFDLGFLEYLVDDVTHDGVARQRDEVLALEMLGADDPVLGQVVPDRSGDDVGLPAEIVG